MQERVEELVLKMIEIFNRDGIEAALEYFDPELEWVAPPEWLEDPVYRGHEGIVRLAGMWTSQFDDYRLVPREFIGLGEDRGVLLLYQRGRIPSSSDSIDQPVGWVVQARDGKLARVEIFFSWEQTRAAAGLSSP